MIGQKLHLRVALVTAATAFALALLASWIQYQRGYSDETRDAQQQLQQLARTVQNTAAIAAYLNNKEIAHDVINGISGNEIVSHASLSGGTGFRIEAGVETDAGAGNTPVELPLLSPFNTTERVGTLRIAPNADRIEARARETGYRQGVVLGTLILLVALVEMFVLHRTTIVPLLRLAHNLRHAVPGETARIEHAAGHAHDEIGGLTDDANKLLDHAKRLLDAERILQAEIKLLEQRYRLIFERASVGIFLFDRNGRLLMVNPALGHIIGPTLGARLSLRDTNCLEQLFTQPADVANAIEQARHSALPAVGDFQLQTHDDSESRWVHCLFTPVLDESGAGFGESGVVQGMMHDITERKQREHGIRMLAERDPLTRLLNRRSAEERLAFALEQSRCDNEPVAILLIDLDRFKPVNDTHGHHAGDHVLVEIAGRMRRTMRRGDIVSRLGGDEFLVALVPGAERPILEKIITKLLTAIREDIEIGPQLRVHVDASIGVALFPDHGTDLNTLLRSADAAMYEVKKNGRGAFQIYRADT